MSSFTGASEEKVRERIQRTLDKIPHEGNREHVVRYLNERGAKGIKPSTLGNDATSLQCFCSHLGDTAIEDLTREDMVSYLNNGKRTRVWRNKNGDGEVTITEREVELSPATLRQRFIIIRAFLQWVRGTDMEPEELKGLKPRTDNDDSIPVDDLLNREDLQAMLKVYPTPREKGIISVLYESGLRAGEFCALNIGSVEFDKYGAVLMLPKDASGLKTGSRRVRLFDSVDYLRRWLDAHPQGDDPDAPLFISMSRRNPEARMTPNALYQFTTRTAEKAGIDKDANPHAFRHAAATERARRGWNEAKMRAFFGWSKGSDMPSRYVHLAGLDYEKMELEERGLLDEEEHSQPALAPITCRVCETDNDPSARFCQNCRNPVSPEAEEIIQERKDERMKELMARKWAEEMKQEIASEIIERGGITQDS